jgi:integrase
MRAEPGWSGPLRMVHPKVQNRSVARRSPGEGSIFRRAHDGLWVGKVSLPDGTRKAVYAKTRAAARAKLIDVQRSITQGLPLPAERETVGGLMDEWLLSRQGVLRSSTVDTYRRHLAHARPALARIRLARLAPTDLERLYASLLAAGRAPMTVRHVHAVLHAMLEHAMRQGRVPRNVASLVDAPAAQQQEMTTLTAEQARRLLDAAKGDPLEALYVLALTTGMRRGELLALRWPDVDLERGSLQVTGGLVRDSRADGGQLRVGPPKTKRSRRQVELGVLAVDALRRHRARASASGFVFATPTGHPLDPGNVLRRSFWPLLARTGVPHIRFHDLRHTAATLQFGMGTHPKVVADMLGHASVAITLDTYSHAVPGIDRKAAEAMDRLLGG